MRRIGLIVAVLMLAAPACILQSDDSTTTTIPPTTTTEAPPPTLSDADTADATAAVRDLLDAWAAGDFETIRGLSPDAPHDLLGPHVAWIEGLAPASAAYTMTGVSLDGAGALVAYSAEIDLGVSGVWSYEGSLYAEPSGDGWQVPWTPAVIHPRLEEGDTLTIERTWPERGAILGTRGITLVTDRAVKTIGVVPERVEDFEALVEGLEEHAGIPRSIVEREVNRPGVRPDWWVPVGWMSLVDFLPVQSQLEAIPGLDLRDATERLPPTGPFADHVLGTTGPITADLLDTLGDPYRPGDVVGLSGLEQEMERSLAGSPSFDVQRVNRFGRVVEVLHSVPGTTPAPLRTTLAVNPQIAAESALADVDLPAALVAVDAESGEVRAIAARPLDGFDRAALGLYPPGSTFKIVTAYGLLSVGYLPDDLIPCPAAVTVGGREFTNAGGADRGLIPFEWAFAYSCNTTFASLASESLGPDGIVSAAAAFGFDAEYGMTIATGDPVMPVPEEAADVAAAAIGQGATQVTPLHQATVAAAVASGTWRAPSLLESDDAGPTVPLDPGPVEYLREMMRLVVTDGTGTAADLAGIDIRGKTGSAEWSDDEPTHAWFVGYWNGLGFAVVVEGGGAGGVAAAPIAARFVEALAG
jgi:cell division protein FtsI/penicillin-binding protein 2